MSGQPWVLGISASHNGAICLLRGDEVVVAIQEERLSRLKRHRLYGARPSWALEYCFEYAGIKPSDLSMVVLSVQDRLKNEAQDVTLNPYLEVLRHGTPVLSIPHHYAHAVAAFATSGLEEAAVLVIDGVGSPMEDLMPEERQVVLGGMADGWEIISMYQGKGTAVTPLEKHVATHGAFAEFRTDRMPRYESLGGMFAACSVQIFGNDTEAGKVMGLAPYGRPDYPVGEFFEIRNGVFDFTGQVCDRFPHNERWPAHRDAYQNLSASVQAALEVALFDLVERLLRHSPSESFCYAGGVALNSVANELILQKHKFKNFFVQPAAEDSGPALGAAYHGLWQLTGTNTRRPLRHDAVGRQYSQADILQAIERAPSIELVPSEDVISSSVDLLTDGKILGWFQGRSELGPRALGQRSILCDPRRPDGKEILNSRVKHREAFRPFAPVVPVEEVENWFDLDGSPPESPFMLRVCRFKEDKAPLVPAVVHVDGTGRLQTVTGENNGRFYELVKRFQKQTGVPVILNTSFNVMGEPIVETPEDALWCFLATGIDYCVLEDVIVTKTATYKAQAVSDLLQRVREIKERGQQSPVAADAEARQAHARAVLDEVHAAVREAVPAIDAEITSHLGRTLPDLTPRNIEKSWREMFFELGWGMLEETTREHLFFAGFLHSVFLKYPDRKSTDWLAVNGELLKAIENELNRKIVIPFGQWLLDTRKAEVEKAAASIPGQWGRFLGEVDAGQLAASGGVPLDALASALGASLSRAPGKLFDWIRQFAQRLDRPAAEVLAELPQRLEKAIAARDASLQPEFRGGELVGSFFVSMQWLFARLPRIPQSANLRTQRAER